MTAKRIIEGGRMHAPSGKASLPTNSVLSRHGKGLKADAPPNKMGEKERKQPKQIFQYDHWQGSQTLLFSPQEIGTSPALVALSLISISRVLLGCPRSTLLKS
jgi:hypothetical protein